MTTSFTEGEASRPASPMNEKQLPSKPNKHLCHAWQPKVFAVSLSHSCMAVEKFWLTRLCRIISFCRLGGFSSMSSLFQSHARAS